MKKMSTSAPKTTNDSGAGKNEAIAQALDALSPYSDFDYNVDSLPGIKIKIRAHKDFLTELNLGSQNTGKNELKKSKCPLQDDIEKVAEVHAGSKKYSIFISQTFALDLNLPLEFFPPCKLTTILFLGAETPSFILSLLDLEDETNSYQVLSYTNKAANSLMENLYKVCGVQFVLLACCMKIKDFNSTKLKEVVDQSFHLRRPYEKGNLYLTTDTVQKVTTAAHILAGSVVQPSNDQGEETFLVVEKAWRDVLSLLIESVSEGIQSNIKMLGDTQKMKATMYTIQRRQESLSNNKNKTGSRPVKIFLNDDPDTDGTEVTFTEGLYASEESEFAWSSSDTETDNEEKEMEYALEESTYAKSSCERESYKEDEEHQPFSTGKEKISGPGPGDIDMDVNRKDREIRMLKEMCQQSLRKIPEKQERTTEDGELETYTTRRNFTPFHSRFSTSLTSDFEADIVIENSSLTECPFRSRIESLNKCHMVV